MTVEAFIQSRSRNPSEVRTRTYCADGGKYGLGIVGTSSDGYARGHAGTGMKGWGSGVSTNPGGAMGTGPRGTIGAPASEFRIRGTGIDR